ncbi:MAG TPA: TIGR03084 family metal-binding protein [Jatrophihabitans sp.]|jgi:uncharacterized protein (TIGR03084 family)
MGDSDLKVAILKDLVADLTAETADLEKLIGGLPADAWATPTPAEPWNILDQIGHLAYFDETATLAATDGARFRTESEALVADGEDYPDRLVEKFHGMAPADMLAWFRKTRSEFISVFDELDPSQKLPWYGPDMAPASSVTARLMETWAHGQDIADALGVTRVPTARIKHIAHLGVRTMGFSHVLRDERPPAEPVYVELVSPDGELWTWGPEDAENRVTGPAIDFVLAVTQRIHRDDTALVSTGPVAQKWLSLAQAFAGAPGPGRPQKMS